MTSLLSLIKEEKLTDIPEAPRIVMDDCDDKHCSNEVEIDVSDLEDELPSPSSKFRCVCFLSDVPMTKKVKEQLKEFKNVKEFDIVKFANRTLDNLYEEHGVEYIWINLKHKDARKWVSKNLPVKSEYFTCISVYSHTKQAKWRTDVKDYCSHSCKLTHLKEQLKALSFGELASNFESLDLHEIPNRILSCLGLQNKLSKKKNIN
jgi:hypothetical protein